MLARPSPLWKTNSRLMLVPSPVVKLKLVFFFVGILCWTQTVGSANQDMVRGLYVDRGRIQAIGVLLIRSLNEKYQLLV